jgi:isopentenyl diphosphate isomerase/L-lactate dehydrogenase-like FMN-dependent dehydrogenase
MLLTLTDYERAAETRLHPPVWDFIAGGAGEDGTVEANRRAFASWRFRPRVATDVSAINTSTDLLGYRWQAPIAIAPTALHELCTPAGELASAAAAAATGLPFVVSMYASRTIEELARTNPLAMLWQQVYLLKDRAVTASFAERAEAAGAGALVVTIDSPWLGRRHRDLRGAFTMPPNVQPRNVVPSMRSEPDFSSPAAHAAQTMNPGLTWKDVTWLIGLTSLPVVCKGIQTGEDAIAAREAGAAAVVVSNHGGRQLEGARATLDALPEVVSAVGADFPVLMDGGIRSGRDVLVALALGAAAILVGRPVLHGLTVAGAAGAAGVLSTLVDELVDAMGHCGRPNLASVGPDLVTPALAALMTLMTPSSTTATDADTKNSTTIRQDSVSTPTESLSVLRNQRRYPWWTEGSVVRGEVPDLAVRTGAAVERSDLNVP